METAYSPTIAREPWNKGKLVGQGTVQAKRDLGDPHSFANGEPMQGIGSLQLGDRQQASSL
jgi:hypothetical protein